MVKRKRRQLMIDPEVQGTLMCRVVVYWTVCLLAITLVLLAWRMIGDPQRMFYTHFAELWSKFGLAFLAAVTVLPLMVMDALRISNRFAGPVYRLRTELRRVVAGEPFRPFSFREGDYWSDLAEDVNTLCARLEELEARLEERDPVEAAPAATKAARREGLNGEAVVVVQSPRSCS